MGFVERENGIQCACVVMWWSYTQVDEYSDSDSNNSIHLAVDMVTGDGDYVCVYSPLSEQALASEYAELSPPGRHPPHSHSCSGQWW